MPSKEGTVGSPKKEESLTVELLTHFKNKRKKKVLVKDRKQTKEKKFLVKDQKKTKEKKRKFSVKDRKKTKEKRKSPIKDRKKMKELYIKVFGPDKYPNNTE